MKLVCRSRCRVRLQQWQFVMQMRTKKKKEICEDLLALRYAIHNSRAHFLQ